MQQLKWLNPDEILKIACASKITAPFPDSEKLGLLQCQKGVELSSVSDQMRI